MVAGPCIARAPGIDVHACERRLGARDAVVEGHVETDEDDDGSRINAREMAKHVRDHVYAIVVGQEQSDGDDLRR